MEDGKIGFYYRGVSFLAVSTIPSYPLNAPTRSVVPPSWLPAQCNNCSAFLSDKWKCSRCSYEPAQTEEGLLQFAPELIDSDELYPAEIIDELARLESQNFWFRSRNSLIKWALREYFPNLKSFFEVGCGNGFVLSGVQEEFRDAALYGCDGLPPALAYAQRRLQHASFYQMDARRLPFVNCFDVAGVFDVIEHIDEQEEVLEQLHKVLVPGGGLLLTAPKYRWLWSKCDDYVKHVRRYDDAELESKVEAAGFRIVKSISFVSLLLPVLVASRIWQKVSPRPYNIMSELRIQGALGGALERVMGIERILIQKGVSAPFGGSVLVIAEKLE